MTTRELFQSKLHFASQCECQWSFGIVGIYNTTGRVRTLPRLHSNDGHLLMASPVCETYSGRPVVLGMSGQWFEFLANQ